MLFEDSENSPSNVEDLELDILLVHVKDVSIGETKTDRVHWICCLLDRLVHTLTKQTADELVRSLSVSTKLNIDHIVNIVKDQSNKRFRACFSLLQTCVSWDFSTFMLSRMTLARLAYIYMEVAKHGAHETMPLLEDQQVLIEEFQETFKQDNSIG